MASINQPSMTYHAQQFRVRVEVTRAQVLASPTHPADLVKRARTKMDSVLKEGKIIFFDVFEERLADIWERLRKADGEDVNLSITFTLAAGAPLLAGFHLEKGPNEKSAVLVSVAEDAPFKNWSKEWLRATIIHKARELGIEEPLSMAQVQACITRILSGEHVTSYSLPLLKAFPITGMTGKVYGVLANKVRGEIAVMVNDLKTLQHQKNIETLNQVIIQTIEKMKQSVTGHFRYHKQDLVDCLANAWRGPERLGIGMPMTVLAVTGQGIQVQATAAAAIAKRLNFRVSPNKLAAHVTGFKTDIYNDVSFKFTRENLTHELKTSGVIFGLTDEIWQAIEAKWNARENLDDVLAAQGTEALPGVDPYLHLVYKDAPELADTGKVIDIREAQQRTLVRAGQMVAEIRYKTPAVPGKTVTGQVVHAPPPQADIKLGTGIVQKETGKFYATEDGLPIYESDTLTVNKTYIHSGDVDLKSGNIRFDGPVEIKGSIDSGAIVDVGGPLIVHGMVRGGFVHSQNGIEVRQGIVTTEKGRVSCKGDLKADFIENSRIECSGTLTVNKAILNSQVFAARSIVVTSNDGVVGGGLVSCREALVSNNVGFPSGAKTIIILGVDVRALKRVTIRTGRLAGLKEAGERYKAEQRELSSKKEAQLTLKHKERKKKLSALTIKLKTVLEHAERGLFAAKESVTYNNSTVMAVYKRLSVNCEIEAAGHKVPLKTEMLSSAVTGRIRRDSHVCTVDDVKTDLDRLLGTSSASSGQDPQKAS